MHPKPQSPQILILKRRIYLAMCCVLLVSTTMGILGAYYIEPENLSLYLFSGIPVNALLVCSIFILKKIDLKHIKRVEWVWVFAFIAYILGWDIANIINKTTPTNEYMISNTPVIVMACIFLTLSVPTQHIAKSILSLFIIHSLLTWYNLLQFEWSVVHSSQINTDVVTVAALLVIALLGAYNAALEDSQNLAKEMTSLAGTDTLTGLQNRRMMQSIMAERQQQFLIQIDLDHFKHVNDQHGHDVGDTTLKTVASILEKTFSPKGSVARWGGEEFLVSLVNVDREHAKTLAQIAQHTVQKYTKHTEAPITISQGLAHQRPEESVDHLIKRADELLYQAKAHGRNCIKTDADTTEQS